MSQENVEIVRRYYEAVKRAFEAYWANPRSAEDAFSAGELTPEGAELARYVHPNIEWKTALTGITYRAISAWQRAGINSWTRPSSTGSNLKRSARSVKTKCLL